MSLKNSGCNEGFFESVSELALTREQHDGDKPKRGRNFRESAVVEARGYRDQHHRDERAAEDEERRAFYVQC